MTDPKKGEVRVTFDGTYYAVYYYYVPEPTTQDPRVRGEWRDLPDRYTDKQHAINHAKILVDRREGRLPRVVWTEGDS